LKKAARISSSPNLLVLVCSAKFIHDDYAFVFLDEPNESVERGVKTRKTTRPERRRSYYEVGGHNGKKSAMYSRIQIFFKI
jgi:hypothetical protein